MTSTITIGEQAVTLVALPAMPAARMVEFAINDTVAEVNYPFSGTRQVQEWMGADSLECTMTMPPLTEAQAGAWKAWLMQMRGMRNAVQVGDPRCKSPKGTALGVPVVDGTDTSKNAAGTQVLYTRGWEANRSRQLLPYDALQLGYRMHYVLDVGNSDADGKMAIAIWPSLREKPADGAVISLAQPRALMRLATNQRKWTDELRNGSRISLQLKEFRGQ